MTNFVNRMARYVCSLLIIGALTNWNCEKAYSQKRSSAHPVIWSSSASPFKGEKGWYLGHWSVNNDGTYNFTDPDGSLAAYAKLLIPQ